MFVVVFEVEPKDGRAQEYLDLAASLRPEVEKIEGFISVERFQSMVRPSGWFRSPIGAMGMR